MIKQGLLIGLAHILLVPAFGLAQNLCPTGVTSDKLICVIPSIYGINGLDVRAPGATGDFGVSFLTNSLSSLESTVARQSTLTPLASPSSGVSYLWDNGAKTFIESTDSYGPILGDRADTVGKYRLSMAFDYQYLAFSSLDGVNLKKVNVVLPQDDFTLQDGTVCSLNGDNTDGCTFIRDVIRTQNRVDLKVHQFTTFFTFGLTNRIDISAAIPLENIRESMFSQVTIVHNDIPENVVHAFPTTDSCTAPCFVKSFSQEGTASGIGDIILRLKGTAWKGERSGLALGMDIRMPTGDSLNYLGSGAAGVKPFVIWSYHSRVSPHVFVGYEANGSSSIAGDISTGSKEKLASNLSYSGGADVWLTKRVTAAFDLVGQEVFQARRTVRSTLPEPGACNSPDCSSPGPSITDPTLTSVIGSYNISNASIGIKFRPFGHLLIAGNVLIKLNDGGLRPRIVPLVGLAYTFSPSK